MLQESPKFKGLGKPGKKHPKLTPIKAGTSRTRKLAKNELGQTLTKYPKQVKFYNEFKPK